MKTLWKILFAGLLLATFPAAQAIQKNGFDLTGALLPLDEILQGGPPRDGIPAIDRPQFVKAGDARFLQNSDRVLGIVRGGIAKAYPVRILNWHEIVNDAFGTERIAVTFCPLCGTGMAYLGGEIRVVAPVLEGDTIRVETEVLEKRESRSNPDRGLVRFKHVGRKQDGTVVVEVERTAMFLKRPIAG